jgi:hypothetical protein
MINADISFISQFSLPRFLPNCLGSHCLAILSPPSFPHPVAKPQFIIPIFRMGFRPPHSPHVDQGMQHVICNSSNG